MKRMRRIFVFIIGIPSAWIAIKNVVRTFIVSFIALSEKLPHKLNLVVLSTVKEIGYWIERITATNIFSYWFDRWLSFSLVSRYLLLGEIAANDCMGYVFQARYLKSRKWRERRRKLVRGKRVKGVGVD